MSSTAGDEQNSRIQSTVNDPTMFDMRSLRDARSNSGESDESVEVDELVEKILVDEAHKQKLSTEIRGMHRHVQMLGDKMSAQVSQIIKQYVATRASRPIEDIRINWGDRFPLTRDIEEINGKLFISTDLARAVVVYIQNGPDERPMYVKLSGGSKKRNALTAPCMKKFARAWDDVNERGSYSEQSSLLTGSLEGLAEYTMLHLEDAAAMFQEIEPSLADDDQDDDEQADE